MDVKLLYNSPLWLAIHGARTCYDSLSASDTKANLEPDKLGEKDKNLLKKLIELGHLSVIEHINYSFEINGITRGALIELTRHRIASYSVKSTRYTLSKNLKNEKDFVRSDGGLEYDAYERAEKYINVSGDEKIAERQIFQLQMILDILKFGYSNDIAKNLNVESLKTNLIFTINARSLRNFFSLRLSPKAHYEIRTLAINLALQLPKEHLTLYSDIFEKYGMPIVKVGIDGATGMG
jgi:thymidylate synthase (FAD)